MYTVLSIKELPAAMLHALILYYWLIVRHHLMRNKHIFGLGAFIRVVLYKVVLIYYNITVQHLNKLILCP